MSEYNEAMKKLMPLPSRIARLPISESGYPTPWFAGTLPDGKRELRVADYGKRDLAVKQRRCWVCGEQLGVHLVYCLGPMCAITRTTSEPPCHLECARFTVVGCPFLTKPRMRRNDAGLDEMPVKEPPGIFIERNPGVTALWVTKDFRTFKDGRSGWLIRVGDPERVEWWAQGREAMRAEVEESIRSGYPALTAEAGKQGSAALKDLEKYRREAEQYLPRAA